MSTDIRLSNSSSALQAQVLYVDSENGINLPTSGDLSSPFLTPEYALTQINNSGIITGNTNTDTTISGISNENNLKLEVGMYLSGTGIPFGSIIIAKGNEGGNANTVTLSKSTTATASGLTLTWFKIYELRLSGSFIITSNIYKEGVWINSQTSRISWGGFNLFNPGTEVSKTPFFILGEGSYFGANIASRLISWSATQTAGFTLGISFGNIETISTTSTFTISIGSNQNHLNVKGGFVNCKFGTVGSFVSFSPDVDFDSYGLLGGVTIANSGSSNNATSGILKGNHETPMAVTVATVGQGIEVIGNLQGSTVWSYSSMRGKLRGNTHQLTASDLYVTNRSTVGTVTSFSGVNNIYCNASSGMTLIVNTNTTVNLYGNGINLNTVNGTAYNYGNNTAELIGTGTTYNYGRLDITSSNSFNGTLINHGTVRSGKIGNALAYTVENYGTMLTYQYGLGGNGAQFTIKNYGVIKSDGAFTNTSAMITLNQANCIFDNYGKLINDETDVTDAVIDKTTGTLYLRQGSYIKVSNGKSPIRCTTNSSASKDVYYFGVTTNCDGTTYGLTFAFDGGSFTPNDLAGGTLFENTNY